MVCGRGCCAAQTAAPHTAAQSDNAQRMRPPKCTTVSTDVCLCLEADLLEMLVWGHVLVFRLISSGLQPTLFGTVFEAPAGLTREGLSADPPAALAANI